MRGINLAYLQSHNDVGSKEGQTTHMHEDHEKNSNKATT